MRAYMCGLLLCSLVTFGWADAFIGAPDPVDFYTGKDSYGDQGYSRTYRFLYGAAYEGFTNGYPVFGLKDCFGNLHLFNGPNSGIDLRFTGGKGSSPPVADGSRFFGADTAVYNADGIVTQGVYVTFGGGFSPIYEKPTLPCYGYQPWLMVHVWSPTITFHYTEPPPDDYWCYFDLQGVAFFDGQTNKSFQAELFVASAIDNTYPGPWSSKGVFTHTTSGAYLDSVHYKLGTVEQAYNVFYEWVIYVPGQLPEQLPMAMTSLSNPNDFHYVTTLDFTDYNTNSPYVPPVPTNSPPDPYIPYPGDDAYDPETPPGPWPPYYSPWPPYYYPPPPLTEWPQYPPPNWPYNTNSPYNPPGPDNPTPDPNNPTNYPNPDPGNTNGAGGGYTLAQWYAMLRSALSDEANSYIPSDPAQYGLTYSNDLLRTVNDYTTKYFAESDKIQTDADVFLVKAKGILDVVSLPLPNVGIKESFSFTFPYLNQVVEIKTSDWPIIGVFRTFMKWIMALLSFWVAFIMIKRTFGRV